MNEKDYLTNKAFCPVPWTGLMYNFDGSVKNCIRSATAIGNIKDNTIEEILSADSSIKEKMQHREKTNRCMPCYDLEQKKNDLNIISDRVFYLKELRTVDKKLYNFTENFSLHTIDIRWSNLCNFSCIYCGPEFSSRWATEKNVIIDTPTEKQKEEFKNYIFKHVKQLKHVYLAGGEPLLMKENLDLLNLLKEENPDVNLRINTNLSKVDTKIYDLICSFKNVHWTVSLETIEKEYEYIRHPGSWDDFLDNLKFLILNNHKISFNMLHFLLNYNSIFECVDFLKSLGFHNNSFIIGPLTGPDFLDVRNLPDAALDSVEKNLIERINLKPGFLLENSYKNMLSHIKIPYQKNLSGSIEKLKEIDARRNLDSEKIFLEFYKWNK